MDHVVYLDSKAEELENLVKGNKSMIVRGASGRKMPHGKVNVGDVLYFIDNNGDVRVKARGSVSYVLNSAELSVEESFETIIKHQDKLQLPDKQFDKLAGKRYLVLIGINKIEEIDPFPIDKTNFTNFNDWILVGKIETVCKDKASPG